MSRVELDGAFNAVVISTPRCWRGWRNPFLNKSYVIAGLVKWYNVSFPNWHRGSDSRIPLTSLQLQFISVDIGN